MKRQEGDKRKSKIRQTFAAQFWLESAMDKVNIEKERQFDCLLFYAVENIFIFTDNI